MDTKKMPPGVQLLPDGRYRVRAALRDPKTGKTLQRELTLETGASEREAVQARADLLVLMRAEGTSPIKPLRLDDYAASWLAAKAPRLRKRVATHYADVLDLRVLPQIGHLAIHDITRGDLEGWVTWAEAQRKEGGELYSARTLDGWWRVLKQLVRDACADHQLVLDPCARLRPPQGDRASRRERQTLALAQLGELLLAVKAGHPDRYAEVCVLALTGMRGGELYGLRWQDLDETREVLTIRHSASHGELVKTKTGDPREAYLPPLVMGLLRQHRREQLAAQHPGLALGLIFPSEVGTLRYVESLGRPLTQASEAIGLGWVVTPQVLRRTYNSLMVAAGVDRLVLRSQIGHTDEALTERYMDASAELKRTQIARVWEALL